MTNYKLNLPAASAITAGFLTLTVADSRADLIFDQDVTNDVIFGGGNANGSFTVDRNTNLGLELGLRAKQRYPSPANVFNSNGDGVYVFDGNGGGQPANRSIFNFEFSANTDIDGTSGNTIADYDYQLFIDYDPSEAVGDVVSFDPFNQPLADHAFGDNTTANGGGTVAANPVEYAGLVANSNLVQQSWNLGFFGSSTDGFSNGGGDQIYSVWFEARDRNTGDLVGQTFITVSNDPNQMAVNPIPEPSSTLLLSILMSAGVLSHRRRR